MVKLAREAINDLNQVNYWLLGENLILNSNINYQETPDKFIIDSKLKESGYEDSAIFGITDESLLSTFEKRYLKRVRYGHYTFMMLDGATIKCFYTFDKTGIIKQTLEFFQSPFRYPFDGYPDLYAEQGDESQLQCTLQELGSVVHFHFDYDPGRFVEHLHPKTHFTFGHYKACRIAVSGPICILPFFHFIIKNFYFAAYPSFLRFLKSPEGSYFKEQKYTETISTLEKGKLHFNINM